MIHVPFCFYHCTYVPASSVRAITSRVAPLQALAFCGQYGLDEKKPSQVKYCVESIQDLFKMPKWQLYVFKAYIGRHPTKGSPFRYYPRLWAVLEARKKHQQPLSEEALAALVEAAR